MDYFKKIVTQPQFFLTRFLICIPGALIVSYIFNYSNHEGYYATIRSVQTVDFNILANSLPTKLSQALQKNDLKEIQRTVNSNYGLFGIVITDCKVEEKKCSSQKVIAKSQPERTGRREKLFPENLLNNPYDLLRDPAPITAEWGFDKPISSEIIPTGRINKGKVIGRVYYIRREPTDFTQNQVDWILTPVESLKILATTGDTEKAGQKLYQFNNSGANRYYLLTNLLGLGAGLFLWRIWERIVYKRGLQQKLNEQKEKELAIRNDRYIKKIENLEISLSNKKQDEKDLQTELSEARKKLDQERKKSQDLENQFTEARNLLEIAKEERSSLVQKLNSAREETNEKWQVVSSLQQQLNSIKQSEINIADLQDKLNQSIQEAANSQKNAELLTKKIEISSEILRDKETNCLEINRQLSDVLETLKQREDDIAEISIIENQAMKSIEILTREKERVELENKQLQDLWQENLQQHDQQRNVTIERQLDDLCDSVGKDHEELKNKNEELKNKLDNVEREKKRLENENELLQEKLRQFEELEADDEDEGINFSSVLDALTSAGESCPNLEVWDSAIKSVDNINYYLPNRVYNNLVILNDVGRLYFENRVGTDINDIFRSKGVTYSMESTTTMNRYGDDRNFRHRGETRQMFRHLKVGRRLRIYFEFNQQTQKVQIGYCGKHLRI